MQPSDRALHGRRGTRAGHAILAYGFRPFFLLAGIHAALAIPWWLGMLNGILPAPPVVPQYWHAHEMLYGFAAAAVAGFLLTAVPSWTGQRGYAGAPLAALVLLWLAGRIAMAVGVGAAPLSTALVDLAFIPALAAMLLPALLRSGNRRNLAFVALLALLFAANLHFHLAGLISAAPLTLGFNAMLFLLAMLGGRIVPAFTASALRQRGLELRIRRYQPLDRVALAAVGAVVAVDLAAPGGILAAAAAGIAALALAAQLGQWQGHRTCAMPIVWVLQIGFAWLPISLALKSAWLFGAPLPPSAWLHALGAGAMATMILGVMSRAALGHTGREVVAPPAVVVAYAMLTAAALLRAFALWLFPAAAMLWLNLSAGLWTAAFAIYVAVYAPILWRPRIDGKPG